MWKRLMMAGVVVGGGLFFLTGAVETVKNSCRGMVMADAKDVSPVLVGTQIPDASIQSMDGKAVSLRELTTQKPTALIFYRGGWCPFCSRHLMRLQEAEEQLLALGYQIVAISPDRPEELKKSIEKGKLGYSLYSDSSVEAIRAMGLAFKVDDKTLEKYKGYGIDLNKSSGQDHNVLPVPAVFLVGTDGIIDFEYVNPDYRTRLESSVLLAAAKAYMEKK